MSKSPKRKGRNGAVRCVGFILSSTASSPSSLFFPPPSSHRKWIVFSEEFNCEDLPIIMLKRASRFWVNMAGRWLLCPQTVGPYSRWQKRKSGVCKRSQSQIESTARALADNLRCIASLESKPNMIQRIFLEDLEIWWSKQGPSLFPDISPLFFLERGGGGQF